MAKREKNGFFGTGGGNPGDDDALARIDGLTGLPNRRYFKEQFDRDWGRAIRETSPISLLAIDIDGLENRDALLRAAAGALKQALKRAADFAAHSSDGEFAMILPNTDTDGALEIAERVRAEIKRATGAKAAVSIGINSERPIIDLPADEFISNAGDALLSAKTAGENKICVWRTDS